MHFPRAPPHSGSAVMGHSREDAEMDKLCVETVSPAFVSILFKTKLYLSMEKEGPVHAETHLSDI